MADKIPDLWPDGIDGGYASPLALLKVLADNLRKRTKGTLEGGVRESSARAPQARFVLFVRAPSLANAIYEILAISHHGTQLYPVEVASPALDPVTVGLPLEIAKLTNRRGNEEDSVVLDTQEDFVKVLRWIFRSPPTVQLLNSLFAQSNEAKLQAAAPAKVGA